MFESEIVKILDAQNNKKHNFNITIQKYNLI